MSIEIPESTKYYRKNRDRLVIAQRLRRNKDINKTRKYSREYKEAYHKRFPWMRVLSSARTRCKYRKHYADKGIKMLLTREQIKYLLDRDKASSLKKPSIDRIDSNGNYELDNCRFIELSENNRRASSVKGRGNKPVNQYTMDWKFIKRHESIIKAGEELGLACSSHIGEVCNGKKVHVKKFRWKFAKKESRR